MKLDYYKNIMWQNGHSLLFDANEDEHRKYPSNSQLAGHRKLGAKLSIPELRLHMWTTAIVFAQQKDRGKLFSPKDCWE